MDPKASQQINHEKVEIEKDTRIKMSSFVIEGGYSLKGKIKPQGAKNEALQVISSVLLTSGEVIIENIPNIIDVNRLIEILKFIGVKIKKLNPGEYSFKADELNLEFLK